MVEILAIEGTKDIEDIETVPTSGSGGGIQHLCRFLEKGAAVNPINPPLEPFAVRDVCRAAGTRVLVALGEMADDVSVSAGEDKLHGIRVTIRVTSAAGVPEKVLKEKIGETFARYTLKSSIEIG